MTTNLNNSYYQSEKVPNSPDRRSTMIVTASDLNFMMSFLKNQEDDVFEPKSPFNRKNQASFRSLSDFPRPSLSQKNQYSSSESSINKQSCESINSIELQGPSGWACAFEKLLEDREGIHVFAEFLKKEISAENIYFWAACERYSHLSESERPNEAVKIFDKYLGPDATEPVNVDSKARTYAQNRLESAAPDLFDSAHKQIFNLMKFDSYPRFLKSDLYKKCLESENKKQKRAFEQIDPLLIIHPHKNSTTKIKKSYSNAERRAPSLLLWNRKVRSQSKDRLKDPKKQLKEQKHLTVSKGSISDVRILENTCNFDAMMDKNDAARPSNLCRIVLPDGANSISQVKDEPIREYINKILEKRGIMYKYFEVFYFDKKTSQPLDLTVSALTLAEQQIKVEQRILFKLDLPNKKVISVKSKANKILSEVLKPILSKYNYKIEEVQGYIKEFGQQPVDTSLPITKIEDKRLLILYKNCDDVNKLPKTDKSNTLDEITNKVFNEVLQGKIDNESVQASTQSEDFHSEASSSTRRKNLLHHLPIVGGLKPALKEECDNEGDGSSTKETGSKKPLIAKLKAGVKLQTPDTKAQELLAEIKRAQRARLEDQRGTEITIPLPEFLLKDKENLKKPEPAPRLSLSESQNSIHNVFNKVQGFESQNLNSSSEFPRQLSPNTKRNKHYDEGEIAFIDSNSGDTTLVFHHNLPGPSSSNYSHDSNELSLYKKFHNVNSPPPLPPKPKARLSNESNSPDKTQYAHNFPSGTFI
uniref:CSON010776 protein n=1 Tax=Culicoides sonorensis TaxID=179676 RepID=A0A336M2D8_CULSO